MIKTINLRKLIPCLLLPLFTGILGALFSSNSREIYSNLTRPPLSPPGVIFPFVWTLLYILLGIACYLVEESECNDKRARQSYLILLGLNILWPLLFFTLGWPTVAAIEIVVLLIFAIITLVLFYNCEKTAGYLILPLVLWVIYATYLNIGVAVLN